MLAKWSKEAVARRILALRRVGKKLNSDYVQKNDHPLYCAACTYWGGWRQAIEGVGLSYDEVRILEHRRPVWSKEKIIKTIKKRRRNREPLNSNHIQTKEKRLYGAAIKYFGGWPQAVAAAGLDYEKLRKVKLRQWTTRAIAQEIIRRSAQGFSIRGGDVCIEDHGLYQAAMRHFGEEGWAKARVLAGFAPRDPDSRVIWNDQTVREEILLLHENGAALNTGSLQGSTYAYLRGAGRKVFGTWKAAVESAGLDYEQIRKMHPPGYWTKSRILETIQGLEEDGVRLSSKAMQLSGGGLFAAAVAVFGSWSQAVEAAGINYRKHCRIWSTKAWLRRMTDVEYKQKVS